MTDMHNEEQKEIIEKSASEASSAQAAEAAAEAKEAVEDAGKTTASPDARAPEQAEKQEAAAPKEAAPAGEDKAVKNPASKGKKKKKASKSKKEEKLSIPALIFAIISFTLLYFWSSCIVPRLGERIDPDENRIVYTVITMIEKAKSTIGQNRTPPQPPPPPR